MSSSEVDSPVPARLERWIGVGSSIVAPVTLLSALLFYFGYVSSRAQYRYFGVDVDTIGLSTRDYVMRSPQALLVPLLVIALGGAVLLLVHLLVLRRPPDAALLRACLVAGWLALVAGLGLLFGYPLVGSWPPYGLVTPLVLAAGVGLVAYALHLDPAHRARPAGAPPWVRPSGFALAVLVVATCLFWTTATVAEWSGRGTAMRTARQLDALPSVILDTRERLYLTDDQIIEETALPAADGQTFRYRYRGLRLLIQGDDRMFLVPERWSPSNSTLLVELDDSVRVRFQFVNRDPG